MTVARPLQHDQQDRADLHILPEPAHNDPGARLLALQATWVQLQDLPDDVATLRRQVGDLQHNQLKLMVLVDKLTERIDLLERRLNKAGALFTHLERRIGELERRP